MHQNSEAKQPKETDEIKKKLESYAALHRRIDNQIERLENLEAVMGSISSPSFDGISGGGGDGTSKQERQVIQKVTLEEALFRNSTATGTASFTPTFLWRTKEPRSTHSQRLRNGLLTTATPASSRRYTGRRLRTAAAGSSGCPQ